MKRIPLIFQIGLGGLALIGLVIVLNGLFQSRPAETGARETPTGVAEVATREATREEKPTAKRTKKAKVDWAEATLDDVKLGKTRTVLEHVGRILVWSWLPDSRRLLVELEDRKTKDAGMQFHIVTVDTKTGDVVEYGYREESDEAPLWIEQTSSVVFRSGHYGDAKPPEIRVGHAGGQFEVVLVEPNLAGVSRQPTTGMLYYLVYEPTEKSVRMLDSSQPALSPNSPFPELSFPAAKGEVDASGRFLAVWTVRSLALLELATGKAHTYQTLVSSEKEAKKQIAGAWSPLSDKFGLLAATIGPGGGTEIALALFRVDTAKMQPIALPANFVLENDWSPTGKFLVARGTRGRMNQPTVFWLVDSASGMYKALPSALTTTYSDRNLVAWSKSGRLAWAEGETIHVARLAP